MIASWVKGKTPSSSPQIPDPAYHSSLRGFWAPATMALFQANGLISGRWPEGSECICFTTIAMTVTDTVPSKDWAF